MRGFARIWCLAPTVSRARFALFDRFDGKEIQAMIHWQRYFAQNMALAAALAGCALAQETVSIAGAHEFSYVRTEIGPGDKAVKGAPYTAEAITETVQTLANGNHIVHKTSAQLARDNEGRTRREQTVDAVGPWASTGGEPLKLITLNDPVAGVTYHLDPKTNSATKFAYPKNMPPPPPGAPSNFFYATVPDGPVTGAALSKLKAEAVTTTAFTAGGIATGPGVALSLRMKEPGEVKTEQLAPQRIGDLQATGTRTTRTI